MRERSFSEGHPRDLDLPPGLRDLPRVLRAPVVYGGKSTQLSGDRATGFASESAVTTATVEEPAAADAGEFADEIRPHPLDQIAALVQSLTFGEMIGFAEAVWQFQPSDTAPSQDGFPMLLHRWATSACSSRKRP